MSAEQVNLMLTSPHPQLQLWPSGRCPLWRRWLRTSRQCWTPQTPSPAAQRSDSCRRTCGPPCRRRAKTVKLFSSTKKKRKRANPVIHGESAAPDYHLDGINPNAEPLALGDDVGDAAAAIGELRLEVDPLPGGRLRHDVYVDLQGSYTKHVFSVAASRTAWLHFGSWWLPSPRWAWPCPGGRTWSVPSPSASRPR